MLLYFLNFICNLICRNQTERRQLGINYIFCLLMVEVLPQLHFFPESCEQSVSYIIALAFKEVAYRDP